MITLLKRYKVLTATLVFAGLTLIATSALAAPAERTSPAFHTTVFSAAQVVAFQEGVGLLDTTNGTVYELRGDLDNASTKLSWFLRVPAIEGSSGFLELQSPRFNRPDALFLVDAVTGATWIFRDRGNRNGSWEAVTR